MHAAMAEGDWPPVAGDEAALWWFAGGWSRQVAGGGVWGRSADRAHRNGGQQARHLAQLLAQVCVCEGGGGAGTVPAMEELRLFCRGRCRGLEMQQMAVQVERGMLRALPSCAQACALRVIAKHRSVRLPPCTPQLLRCATHALGAPAATPVQNASSACIGALTDGLGRGRLQGLCARHALAEAAECREIWPAHVPQAVSQAPQRQTPDMRSVRL